MANLLDCGLKYVYGFQAHTSSILFTQQLKVVMHFLCSETFADALQRVGAQDPLRGGKDELLEDLLSIIHAGDTEAPAKNSFDRINAALLLGCPWKCHGGATFIIENALTVSQVTTTLTRVQFVFWLNPSGGLSYFEGNFGVCTRKS
ncbi:hypothetical protein IFM89_007333 [Coptis chinensis]|uniref:Uncharacterized protein n=1 Tax=Coptis chinensis TaxID=261450 RepID=A0A835GXS4_9MAGN|nr:hypothetical protein IFM89_007333 [Coptis chinensis]